MTRPTAAQRACAKRSHHASSPRRARPRANRSPPGPADARSAQRANGCGAQDEDRQSLRDYPAAVDPSRAHRDGTDDGDYAGDGDDTGDGVAGSANESSSAGSDEGGSGDDAGGSGGDAGGSGGEDECDADAPTHSDAEDENNPGDDASSSSSGSSSSSTDEDEDEDGDAEFALESALRADLASGLSLPDAVRSLFGSLDESGPATHRRLRALNLASPVLAALRADPALCDDVRAVAAMCRTIYTLAEPAIHALRAARSRLSLGLRGLHDVASVVQNARSVVALVGAGVSVACGVPDFRSAGGVYERVSRTYGLADPQLIFDLAELRVDPSLFFSFARHVMPAPSVAPSAAHFFLAQLERAGKLRRVYSQNIDGLERRAGVSDDRLVLCHGSFLTGTCMTRRCGATYEARDFVEAVQRGAIPRCPRCERAGARAAASESESESEDDASAGVIKPDIVFFGERLPSRVEECLVRDADAADLVLVLGTSLKVHPVSGIPRLFGDAVPRVLVNRELVGYPFDVELLGDCDAVVRELRRELGWDARGDAAAGEAGGDGAQAVSRDVGDEDEGAVEFIAPRRFLFKGAGPGLRRTDDEDGASAKRPRKRGRDEERDVGEDGNIGDDVSGHT